MLEYVCWCKGMDFSVVRCIGVVKLFAMSVCLRLCQSLFAQYREDLSGLEQTETLDNGNCDAKRDV